MYLVRITTYPWLPPQTAIRYTLEQAIALRDELVAMGYSVDEIIEVKVLAENESCTHQVG